MVQYHEGAQLQGHISHGPNAEGAQETAFTHKQHGDRKTRVEIATGRGMYRQIAQEKNEELLRMEAQDTSTKHLIHEESDGRMKNTMKFWSQYKKVVNEVRVLWSIVRTILRRTLDDVRTRAKRLYGAQK